MKKNIFALIIFMCISNGNALGQGYTKGARPDPNMVTSTTGVSGRGAYWCGTYILCSDAGFTYDATTDALTIGGHIASATMATSGAATVGTTLAVTGATSMTGQLNQTTYDPGAACSLAQHYVVPGGTGASDLVACWDGTADVSVDREGDVLVGGTLGVSGLLTAATLKVTTTPTSGHVLTSDASGNATWTALPAGVALTGSTAGQIPVVTGANAMTATAAFNMETDSSVGKALNIRPGTTNTGYAGLVLSNSAESDVAPHLQILRWGNTAAGSVYGVPLAGRATIRNNNMVDGSVDLLAGDGVGTAVYMFTPTGIESGNASFASGAIPFLSPVTMSSTLAVTGSTTGPSFQTTTGNFFMGTAAGFQSIWNTAAAKSAANYSIDGAGAYNDGASGAVSFRTSNTTRLSQTATLLTATTAAQFDSTVTATGTASASKYLTATNCSSAAGTCAAASTGAVTIAAAATSVVVATTAVTANSVIFPVFDSSLGTRLGVTCNTTAALPTISARVAATSFTVTIAVAPVTNPACYSYLILN